MCLYASLLKKTQQKVVTDDNEQQQPYTFRNNNPLYYESRDTFAPLDQTQPTEPEESPKAELGEIIANDQKTALESYVRKNLHPETVTNGYSQKILINRWIEADIREIDRREKLAEQRYLRETEALDARWSAKNEIKAVQETSSGGYASGRTIITPNGAMFIQERMSYTQYQLRYYEGGIRGRKDTAVKFHWEQEQVDLDELKRIAEKYINDNLEQIVSTSKDIPAMYKCFFYRESKQLPWNWKANDGYLSEDHIEDHTDDMIVSVQWNTQNPSRKYTIMRRSSAEESYGEIIEEAEYE